MFRSVVLFYHESISMKSLTALCIRSLTDRYFLCHLSTSCRVILKCSSMSKGQCQTNHIQLYCALFELRESRFLKTKLFCGLHNAYCVNKFLNLILNSNVIEKRE